MREEDKLAARHGKYDYRTQDAKDQRIIEEQRQKREQLYSDQLAHHKAEDQKARAAEKQRRAQAAQSKRGSTKSPGRTGGKPANQWIQWSTGWGFVGAVAGAIASSSLFNSEIPIEGLLVSAAIAGILIGFLWRIILTCAVLAGVVYAVLYFSGAS